MRRLALIGANGMLAERVKAQAPPGFSLEDFDLPDFDLTDREQVMDRLGGDRFDVILNCAAYTNVDGCESEEDLALRVNGQGPKFLAEAALAAKAALVHVSTDYVFAGDQSTPYHEDDPTAPGTAYGRTKLAGEVAIRQSGLQNHAIIRTSWLYGPGGKNFVETILRLAAERDELGIVGDQVGSPTFAGDLASALYRLLETENFGLYHFANTGSCSWYEFAGEIVRQAKERGLLTRVPVIRPLTTEQYPLPARRPGYSVLATGKIAAATGLEIPAWQEALGRYLTIRG